MKTTKQTGLAWGVLCALTGVLPACGADATGSSDDPNARPDDIGVAQQELFESTCWNQGAADALINITGQGISYASSANASYGRTSCPHQFIVDVIGIANRPFEIDAQPTAQSNSNMDWCSGFWGKTKVMGWNGSTSQQVDYYEEVGFYTSAPFGWPFCSESTTAGHRPDVHPIPHPFKTLRIVTAGGWATSYQPVTVMVSSFL